MPALTPVSEEEFIRIASEEGVPLPLAAAFYAIESGAGTDASAFIDPREKAGKPNGPNSKWNSDAGKIGFGSMQLTKATFEDQMPGMDFYTATDSDLTRAGMRLLKKTVREDGTFDYGKAKVAYFGGGEDKSFRPGYIPSADTAVDDKLKRVLFAVGASGENQSPQSLRATILKAMGDTSAPKWDGGVAVATQRAEAEVKVANDRLQAARTNHQVDADFAGMEATLRTAQENFSKAVQASADQKAQLSTDILNQAEINPYGAFNEMQKTLEALKSAQNRLRDTVDAKNFKGPTTGNPLVDIVSTFLRKVGADATYDSTVKQTQALQASAQNYQNIISKLQENASKSIVDPQTLIQASQESRAVGLDAIRFPMEKLALDKFNAQQAAMDDRAADRNEMSLLRLQNQQAVAAANEARKQVDAQSRQKLREEQIARAQIETDLRIETLRATAGKNKDPMAMAQVKALSVGIARQRINALEDNLTDERAGANNPVKIARYERDLELAKGKLEIASQYGQDIPQDFMSDAANKFMAARSTNGQYVPHDWTYKEIKDQILSNKELKPLFDKFIVEGFDPQAVVGTDIEANAQKLQTSSSATERAVGDLGSTVVQNKIISILDREMGRRFPKKGDVPAATWQSAINNPMQMQGKEKLKDELYAIAQKRARDDLASLPVNELNAQSNPANVIHTPQEWMQIAGTGGLADTVAAIKMDPKNLESDAKLISTLVNAGASGRLPITFPQLLEQLQSYYSAKADLRAADSAVKALKIPMDKNTYIVTTRDEKRYNLASAPELKAYLDRVRSGLVHAFRNPFESGRVERGTQFEDQFFQALDSTKGN